MKNALTSGSVFGDPVRFSLPYPLAFLADALRHGGSVPHRAVSTTAVSVVLTGVLLLLVRPIVSVMSTPAAAVDGTVAYLTICFLGVLFITAYNVISSVFRGMGESIPHDLRRGGVCRQHRAGSSVHGCAAVRADLPDRIRRAAAQKERMNAKK